MSRTVLRTERLELRPFAPGDRDDLHALFTDAAVRRFLLDGQLVGRDWVATEIRASEARFREGGAGIWAVRERGPESRPAATDGAAVGTARIAGRGSPVVGFVGYRPFFEPPELQLLYGFLPDCWGRGYATEAAGAAIRYGFDALGLEEIRAATDPPNEGSIRVLERLGFDRIDCSTGAPRDTLCFALGRPARRAASID